MEEKLRRQSGQVMGLVGWGGGEIEVFTMLRPWEGLGTVGLPLRWGPRKEGNFRETLRPVWDTVIGRSLGDVQREVSRSP